ncbi:MAG: hypothetical protein GX663_08630 [Clostridiales bacterium]|nr:hypothetical protein [Clostridiales bacterium]
MVSPVHFDCGSLCGAACCTCTSEEKDSMGIYLLPGEEKLFTRKESWLGWNSLDAEEYEFPDSWHGKVFFLDCKAKALCPRNRRPIQCRTFPLAPHIDEKGALVLIYQKGPLPYSCPLVSRRMKLNNDFVKATYTVWKHLIREPLIYDLIKMDSTYRLEDGEEIDILMP